MSRIQKTTTLYPHPFSRAYWRDAAAEMKDTRMLVFAALMIAVRVAMKGLYIPLGPTLRINTAFIANALGAMVFGPVVAILGAIISDTLGCIIFPSGVYFFPYVFVEIAGSLIFALFLYRAKVTPMRVMLSRFCIDFFVNIVLSAPITLLYYKVVLGKSYLMFQIPHFIKELFMFPLESLVLTLFLSVMLPITNRMKLTYGVPGHESKLRFAKKEIALMCALFVVGSTCLGLYMKDYYSASVSAKFTAEERFQKNCKMNGIVLDQTDDWDGQTTVTIIESANVAFGKSYTTYTVGVYVVDEAVLAENAAAIKAEDPDAVYNLDTLRGYSKTPASKDSAMTRVADATIRVNTFTGKLQEFEITPVPEEPAE